MDDKMIEFLVAYQKFARGVTIHGLEQGLHNPYGFSTSCGLCAALSDFVEMDVTRDVDEYIILRGVMYKQMRAAIVRLADNESYHYPFGGEEVYSAHSHDRTQHENPERLKFVDDYLSELYTNIGLPAPAVQKMEDV